MAKISESNYNIEQWSSGIAAGCVGTAPTINDNDDGTYDIGTFDVLIYENTNHEGPLTRYNIPASSGRDLTASVNQVTYLVVDNNTTPGSPVLADLSAGQLSLINESNIIPIITMFNDNNEHIHRIDWDTLGQGLPNMIHKRVVKTDRVKRESGLTLSTGAAADHHVELTGGTVWVGAVEHVLEDADTSSAMGDIVSYDGNSGTGATFAVWGVDNEGATFGAVHVDVKSGGSGYASDETGVTVAGGSGSGLTIDYHQVGGEIVEAWVNNAGINYETTTALYFYHHTGTGLTITTGTVGGGGELIPANVSLGAGGTRYFVGDKIEVTGGGGTGALVRIDTVGVNNAVTGFTVIRNGSGYSSGTHATYEGWTYQRYADQTGVYPNDGYVTSSGYFPTTSNDWVVSWWYRDLEDEPHFGYVLGDQAYSSYAEALDSTTRSDLPSQFSVISVLCGRIITKDSNNVDAASPNTGLVESAFTREYTGTQVTNHNDLGGLQGGTTSEYYHADQTAYDNLLASSNARWTDVVVPLTSSDAGALTSPTFTKINDDGAGSDGIFLPAYPDGVTTYDQLFVIQLPHGYVRGSDIYLHLHWFNSTAGDGTVVVDWVVEWQAHAGGSPRANGLTDINFTANNTLTTAQVDLTTIFSNGETLEIQGSTSNDGTYTVNTVAAGTLTVTETTWTTGTDAGPINLIDVKTIPTNTTLTAADSTQVLRTAEALHVTPLVTITGTDLYESSMIIGRITRDTGTDDYTGAAYGYAIDAHILVEKLGTIDQIPHDE